MARSWTLPGLALAFLLAGPASAQNTPAPGSMMGPGYGMGSGSGMHGPGMMGPMGMAAYPDGYAAFLKTELGITTAQEGVWDRFAKVLKDRLGKRGAQRGSLMGPGMMGGGGNGQSPGFGPGRGMGPGMMGGGAVQPAEALPAALDREVGWAQERLDSLKALRDAAKPLYAALSAEQKAKADQLLGWPMGMY
jgi:LTXXQ motif family protein